MKDMRTAREPHKFEWIGGEDCSSKAALLFQGTNILELPGGGIGDWTNPALLNRNPEISKWTELTPAFCARPVRFERLSRGRGQFQ